MMSLMYGMVPGGNVGDAIARVLRVREPDWVAVIRSLDSASSPEDLASSLAFHHVPYKLINGNVCIAIDALAAAPCKDLFTGFDEVWIISGNAPAFELAALPCATSDGTDFSSGMPSELSIAMEKTNCVLIIGDGCGLNYATFDQQIQEQVTKVEAKET